MRQQTLPILAGIAALCATINAPVQAVPSNACAYYKSADSTSVSVADFNAVARTLPSSPGRNIHVPQPGPEGSYFNLWSTKTPCFMRSEGRLSCVRRASDSGGDHATVRIAAPSCGFVMWQNRLQPDRAYRFGAEVCLQPGTAATAHRSTGGPDGGVVMQVHDSHESPPIAVRMDKGMWDLHVSGRSITRLMPVVENQCLIFEFEFKDGPGGYLRLTIDGVQHVSLSLANELNSHPTGKPLGAPEWGTYAKDYNLTNGHSTAVLLDDIWISGPF